MEDKALVKSSCSTIIKLAQTFCRLGSEVDLVHSGSTLLPKDEPEAGEVLRRQFETRWHRLALWIQGSAGGKWPADNKEQSRNAPA